MTLNAKAAATQSRQSLIPVKYREGEMKRTLKNEAIKTIDAQIEAACLAGNFHVLVEDDILRITSVSSFHEDKWFCFCIKEYYESYFYKCSFCSKGLIISWCSSSS